MGSEKKNQISLIYTFYILFPSCNSSELFTKLERQPKWHKRRDGTKTTVTKYYNRCSLMAPFIIPLKSLRLRGKAENHCSIMYVLPLPSEELVLTRWRIPS